MNKIIYSVLTLFLISVTITSCNNVLIPEETHHYIHIVDDSPITQEVIMPMIARGED